MIARARSDSRKRPRRRRARVLGVPAERRLLAPAVGEVVEAGDAARGDRLQRAGRDEVDADAVRAEVARQVAARPPPAPPWRRPSSRRPARRPCASKSSPTIAPRVLSGVSASARSRSENARHVERRLRALGRGAEEVAAERVGGREGDRVQRAVDAAPARVELRGERVEVLGSLTSSSSTSAGSGSRAAARSVSRAHARRRSARPRRPAAGPGLGGVKAIESRVSAPVIRMRLPSSITAARRSGRRRP